MESTEYEVTQRPEAASGGNGRSRVSDDEAWSDVSEHTAEAQEGASPTGRERPRHAYDDTVSLLDLLNVLARRKWLILITTFVAAVGVVLFSYITIVMPPGQSPLANYYRAQALALINDDSAGGAGELLAQSPLSSLADLGDVGGQSYGELALRLLESRTLLDAVAAELNVAERFELVEHPVSQARDLLRGKATFEFDSATGILSISLEDTDPVFARDAANAFLRELESLFGMIGLNRVESQLGILEEKLAEVESNIGRLEQRLVGFQQEHGAFNVEGLAQERLNVLARIRSDLILKDVEIQAYRDFAPANDPTLSRMREERESLQELLVSMEEGTAPVDGLMPSQQQLPALAIEYARLQRDLAVQTEIYTSLSGQYEVQRLSAQTERQIFQTLEQAEVPEIKAGPSRSMISIIVTVTAFFLAVFLAFVLEYFAAARRDPDERAKLDELRENLRLRPRRS